MNSRILIISSALLMSIVPLEFANGQHKVSGIPKGYTLIEGDMIVPENFLRKTIPSGGWEADFWPNGIVPFIFDVNVTMANQNLMLSAMAEWENVATVDFIQRTNEDDYVDIRDSANDEEPTNSSQVGRVGGRQVINIVSWGTTFIMAHELAHALGMIHEQSRPDRDDYVRINEVNIEAGKEDNFEKRSSADVYPKQAYGLRDDRTYDFDSVMHYSQFDFTNCNPAVAGCETIIVLPPNNAWQSLIGQRDHLSDLDQLTMSFLYPRRNWYFVDKTHSGSENGSFIQPYKRFIRGMSEAPNGARLWIQPGMYAAVGTYNKPITLDAPLGHVTLGQ